MARQGGRYSRCQDLNLVVQNAWFGIAERTPIVASAMKIEEDGTVEAALHIHGPAYRSPTLSTPTTSATW